MTALDRLIPAPALMEIDHVEIAATPARVWDAVRHLDLAGLGHSRLARRRRERHVLLGRLVRQLGGFRHSGTRLTPDADGEGFGRIVD